MHLGRNVTYECSLSQSLFYQVLNVVNDGMFKRKCLNGEIIFHKRDTEKGVFFTLQVKNLISSSGLKKICAHFNHAANILLWGTKYCDRKQFCSNYLERTELKVFIIFPMENKLTCFANS